MGVSAVLRSALVPGAPYRISQTSGQFGRSRRHEARIDAYRFFLHGGNSGKILAVTYNVMSDFCILTNNRC